ncbi:MAG: M14 family zinc carboxypeptidase, partial [Bacteroidota bacterium]
LFNYEELIDYIQKLDELSDRLEMRMVGTSPMGKPMYIAFFSSPENISRLDELKDINKELAINPQLNEAEQERMINEGKVFVMATLSMHSGEVGPAQSAPLTAYDLCITEDPQKLKWLDKVVYMMIPNHNPDGMNMIVDYYNETKGTKYEGSSHPGVYHKYVGHDNNRDFVILSQKDTKVIADIYNNIWYPQVFVEKHQMGSTGTRYFVPPNHDPIAMNVDEGIWNWTGIFGANVIKDMTREDLAGVSQHYLFDDYWPGSTETCIWKNVIGFLTECASAKYATPVYVEPTELSVSGKGLSEYKKSINMPDPWPGGWWRLSDIVQYEIVSVESILKTASTHKDDILRFRNDLCKKQVNLGKTTAPYHYVLPLDQHDKSELVKLVNLLSEHGINIYHLNSDVRKDNMHFSKGDIVVPLSQPYRAFIKEVMEKQDFPVRHYTPGGEIIKPYDITTWSLPLHNGLKSFELNEYISEIDDHLIPVDGKFSLFEDPGDAKYLVFPVNLNESYQVAFHATSKGIKVDRLVKDKVADNNLIEKGSFVIKNSKNGKLQEVLSECSVSPLEIDADMELQEFSIPEIALVESWFHDMDAGWTRFLLDSYHIPFKVLRPGDFKSEDISEFDVIIFPDENKSILMEGKYKSGSSYYMTSYAPEYTKGMGKEGLKKLMKFIHEGGKVISWGQSTSIFEGMQTIEYSEDEKEEFQLPFRDVSESLQKKGLYCPGSLIRMKLDPDHPVTAGMPEECGIFYRGKPVFRTSIPNFDMDRRVLGVIPGKEILMSGYCEEEDLLENKAILVWMKKGKGQLVLMGFNPQFRSSTHLSYKLLFNSILL